MEYPYPEWATLVFRGREGRPLAERSLHREFKKLLAAVGLDDDICLYDCRHTFNAILSVKGVSAEVRRDLMGHSTTLLVEGTCSHVMPTCKLNAAEKFDELLGDCLTE